MTLLVDLADVPACQCNTAFDDLYKAMAELPDGDEATIWTRVANPWIAAHVEEVTRRLQAILRELQDRFSQALFGEPALDLAKAEVPWKRWDSHEMEEVRFRLEQKPTADYTLEDWLQLVDWLIQRYLPDGVIQSEAEHLTVKAALLGKIQATMEEQAESTPRLDALVDLVPTTFREVPPRVLRPVEMSILRVAKAQCGIYMGNVAAEARAKMSLICVEHVQAQILGQREGTAQALRQRLFDEFGILNKDFRRIAVTEIGEVTNQGVVAATPYGGKLRRVEAYRGACEFCRSINGKVFTVVDPNDPNKDGKTQIWVGKTNVGRSAAPRKRVGNALMERGENELWWPAAGLQHAHCRGAWTHVQDKPPQVSQEYADWLGGMLKEARAKAGLPLT